MKNTDIQIMLIDNDPYVRESLGTFFKKAKQRVLIFKSGAEGLNSLTYQDVDVVISDYFLPDMDGLTFLKKVEGIKPGIFRVLMATLSSDELKHDLYMAGIDAFLEKPLSITDIDQIIANLKTDK